MKYVIAANDAYYGGRNKKYRDMVNISPDFAGAKLFDSKEDAEASLESLQRGGWTEFGIEEAILTCIQSVIPCKYPDAMIPM